MSDPAAPPPPGRDPGERDTSALPADAGEAARPDKREANKARRRERILASARALIIEAGAASFSMQMLADRSNVSLATIYNLIGQKHDLLLEIFSTDLDVFNREVAGSATSDPLDRTFEALDIATRHLFHAYDYSRALFGALFSTSGHELARLFQRPRANYWAGMVTEAMEKGLLLPDAKPPLVSSVLDDVYRSVMMRWLWIDMDARRFRALLGHRFAIVLLAFATPEGAVRLRRELTRSEEQLTRQRVAQDG
ncbi:TetR/AcrR family transcriptional regulator [Zavarzinia sp. CC-PAN008]|uniref:TetR/AcrR family transcriptional regulator n=1 Tax=Zavarzinia sp. CC-PAN008 TaxID=3243332 RepID=UPI003F7456EC